MAKFFERKSKERDYMGRLNERISKVPSIAIGFPYSLRTNSSAREKNGASVIDVAIWNNFGTEKIPERRFMEASSKAIPEETKDIRIKLAKAIYRGNYPMEQAMDIIGAKAVMVMRKIINDWDSPPNAPITVHGGWMIGPHGKPVFIKGKKANNPLIDTGLMRNMVTWEIREKGKEKNHS